jgi:hypothetical protein
MERPIHPNFPFSLNSIREIMTRSLFAHVLFHPRGIVVLSVVALVFGFVFQSEITTRVLAQRFVETVSTGPSAAAEPIAPATSNDIFLQLAETVGQAAAAQRLLDYKLKNDPSGEERYWGIVDFSQPSTAKRLYIFDTLEKKVSTYYVAHGKGSEGTGNIPAVFSNQSGSNSSSLGIYRTLGEYVGQHGRSLRLEGLETTNSNALARAVVMHTADYVSESFIRQTGRLGRSQGCFAVERAVGDTLINQLKNGAYIIAAKN